MAKASRKRSGRAAHGNRVALDPNANVSFGSRLTPEQMARFAAMKESPASQRLVKGQGEELERLERQSEVRRQEQIDLDWKALGRAIVDALPAKSSEAVEQRDADKSNGQSDTPKKTERKSKRRLPDKHAKACIKEFKEYRKIGDPQSMRDIVK